MASLVVDCLIIGGGYAGLSAAASLVRTLHTTIIFDEGTHRDDVAPHIVTIPSRDSLDPIAFRESVKRDILESKYDTAQFVQTKLVKIEKINAGEEGLRLGGFRVSNGKGDTYVGRKVILATGVDDVFPNIPGYAECWATGIFHCLVHRGWEQRGCPSAGVLCVDAMASLFAARHLAFSARNLTENVTIYTNGNDGLATEVSASLSALNGFSVDSRPIASLEASREPYASKYSTEPAGQRHSSVIINFKDGSSTTETFIVHRPRTIPRGNFAEQLGAQFAEAPMDMGRYVKTVSPYYETTVPGMFVAGDAGTPYSVGIQAVAVGAFAAGGVLTQVNNERWSEPSANDVKSTQLKEPEEVATLNGWDQTNKVEGICCR